MEGYETVEQLRDSLKRGPAVDPEKATEGPDIDYVVSDTLHKMSEIPKDMSGTFGYQGINDMSSFHSEGEGGGACLQGWRQGPWSRREKTL